MVFESLTIAIFQLYLLPKRDYLLILKADIQAIRQQIKLHLMSWQYPLNKLPWTTWLFSSNANTSWPGSWFDFRSSLVWCDSISKSFWDGITSWSPWSTCCDSDLLAFSFSISFVKVILYQRHSKFIFYEKFQNGKRISWLEPHVLKKCST